MGSLSLQWAAQPVILVHAMQRLRDARPSIADVALAADGGPPLKAHRLVLAAFSPYFEEVLCEHSGNGELLVMLPGVKRAHLHLLLDYMYVGKVNVPVEDFPELMQLGNMLKFSPSQVEDLISYKNEMLI